VPAAPKKLVVFVHGYSVRSTNTYGKLPARLIAEAEADGRISVDVRHVWLGKYVSFNDAVRLEDLARGFDAVLNQELGKEIEKGRRFACITHSSGGPLVREWWQRYWIDPGKADTCPMSHLVQLAPANFGSALAQLGKERLSRIAAWFQGVEPGTGVLDWLELGSPESWKLNEAWIRASAKLMKSGRTFPFVLTGQSIDHKLYDHVNSYTGEIGSDGVVRVASASLNANWLRLEQERPRRDAGSKGWIAPALKLVDSVDAAPTALAILPGIAHSGTSMGILASVKADERPHPTVKAVLECLAVETRADYAALVARFDAFSEQTQLQERVEVDERFFLPDVTRIHDKKTMMIVRVHDENGWALDDFDLLLTGENGDPNKLPQDFLDDRQKNRRARGTLTFFLNHDILHGCPEVRRGNKVVRPAQNGLSEFGIRIVPRPTKGFVHYLPCELRATKAMHEKALRANNTTLIDVTMRRVVTGNTFMLTRDLAPKDFTKTEPGDPIA
jgi:hypothetical protein